MTFWEIPVEGQSEFGVLDPVAKGHFSWYSFAGLNSHASTVYDC
jgi:hypothetical protein